MAQHEPSTSTTLDMGAELDQLVAQVLGWSYRERPMADVRYPDGRRILQGAAFELWDRDGNIQGIGKTHESARCFFTEEAESADFLKEALQRLGITYAISHDSDGVSVATTGKVRPVEARADTERVAMARFVVAMHEQGTCMQLPLRTPQVRIWPDAN